MMRMTTQIEMRKPEKGKRKEKILRRIEMRANPGVSIIR